MYKILIDDYLIDKYNNKLNNELNNSSSKITLNNKLKEKKIFNELLKLNTAKYTEKYKYYYNFDKPIINDLIVPFEFNKKFTVMYMPNYNLTFNYDFDNIYNISGKKIIINGVMENLKEIFSFEELIINNKINFDCLTRIDHGNKIIFNYIINEKIYINCCQNENMHLINNTNKNINIELFYETDIYKCISDTNIIIKPKREFIIECNEDYDKKEISFTYIYLKRISFIQNL